MRVARVFACCVAFALPLTGCIATLEEKLIQEGIGTELVAEDIVDSTRRLDAYVTYLCGQAGMARIEGSGPDAVITCDMGRYGNAGWSVLVRAGFNDIDRRCDSYLSWLNSRRRNRTAVLSQLSDMRTFTEALMYTTGAGAAPLAIAGLAFGLASNTFTNYYSRLLFEIEKSTVQVLVHEKRLQYRAKLGTGIAFQPDAVHVLREYLLICTPFYIEDLINQRTRDSVSGNIPADKGHSDQIRRALVATAFRNAIPTGPREALPGGGRNPPPPPVELNMTGGATGTERSMPKSTGQAIQANLCVQPTSVFDNATREAIRQAKVGGNQSGPESKPFTNNTNQIASPAEAQIFINARPCNFDTQGTDRGYQTAFEKFTFASDAGVRSLQQALAFCDPTLTGKFTGRFDGPTRAAIGVAKTKLNASRRQGLTDLDTDTLNDASYNAISRTCR